MKKLLIISIMFIMLIRCDLTSPDRFESDILVVAGYLQAGKSITVKNPIWIRKTASVNGSNFLIYS